MSLGYSITIEIGKQYSHEAVKKIIEKGISLGFNYQKLILGNINFDIPFLDKDSAIELAFNGDVENTMNAITIQLVDSYPTLHFLNHDGNLTLLMTNFTYPWLKKFEDGDEDIDIGKYAKIMLDLVEDYKILEMKIEKD